MKSKNKRYYTFRLILLSFLILLSVETELSASYLDNIQVDYLKNDLKIITIVEKKDPIISFQVWYKTGGRNEVTGKTGLAHLTEHMMFKGSKNFKKGEVSKIVAKNGGKENAFTNQDYTAYFQNFSKDKLEISLKVESDRMQNLIIDDEEFQLERAVVMEERRERTDDNPISSVVEALYATAFTIHPYRNPTVGWMTDLENLTVKDLKAWYKTYYQPNNATIILIGDFSREKALPLIKKYFESIPKGATPPTVTIKEPVQLGEKRVDIIKKAELPFIFLGYKTPNIGNNDEFSLELLANILSSGKSSRLYNSLIYNQKIALYSGSSYDSLSRDPNLFYFYAAIKPGVDINIVENALYAEVEKIKNSGVADKELLKVKNQAEASFIMSQDSIFYQAMLIGRLESAAIKHTYLNSYLDKLRSVTKEDIQRVAKKYLIKKSRTVGRLIPLKEVTNND